MRFLKTSGALLWMVALATGCATIAGGGTTQSISIRTEPTPAEFIVRQGGGEEIASGRTPGALVLRRGKDYVVEFRCDGQVTQTLAVKRSLNGWVWFNLVFGGIIGFAVDFSNGAAFKLEPAAVVARPEGARAGATAFCPAGPESLSQLIELSSPSLAVQ